MLEKLSKDFKHTIVFLFVLCFSVFITLGGIEVYNVYRDFQNQEAQMNELYTNDAFFISKLSDYKEFSKTQMEKLHKYYINKRNKSVLQLIKAKTKINFITKENTELNKLIETQDDKINSQNTKIVDLIVNLAKMKKELVIKEALNETEAKLNKIERPSYDYLESVTVYIFNNQSENKGFIGTGVIINQNSTHTYILTNKHLCDENTNDCNIVIFKYGMLRKIPLEFVRQTESKYDLSLWRTAQTLPNKQAIKGLKSIKKQDRVYSVGNYLGNSYIYTEGTFAGYGKDCFIFNLPCATGCSGSGIFDKDGYLVSLIYAGNKLSPFQVETAKILGIPYEIVKLFLRDLI